MVLWLEQALWKEIRLHQIDGKDVTTLIELKEQIDAKSPGDTILVSYTHKWENESTQVTLGQSSSN